MNYVTWEDGTIKTLIEDYLKKYKIDMSVIEFLEFICNKNSIIRVESLPASGYFKCLCTDLNGEIYTVESNISSVEVKNSEDTTFYRCSERLGVIFNGKNYSFQNKEGAEITGYIDENQCTIEVEKHPFELKISLSAIKREGTNGSEEGNHSLLNLVDRDQDIRGYINELSINKPANIVLEEFFSLVGDYDKVISSYKEFAINVRNYQDGEKKAANYVNIEMDEG